MKEIRVDKFFEFISMKSLKEQRPFFYDTMHTIITGKNRKKEFVRNATFVR